MGDQESSDKYEGMDLCTIDDVEDEIGPVLSKQSSTVFPDNRRDSIIGRWCEHEQAKFFHFVGIKRSELKGDLLFLARDAVLFRVVNRVLKKVQSNRTQRAGGVPSYQDLIVMYQSELDMLELHIREEFFKPGKQRDEQYPLGYTVSITVVDDDTEEALPGARVYVDNEWLSTTWKDGKIDVPIEDDEDEHEIVVKMAGYDDSAFQEVTEETELVFRLVPE
jgi:hypothetical protein